MIEFPRIRQVMEEMGTKIAPIKLLRADQNGPRPSYPVATYKVMQLIGWQPHQYIVTDEVKEGDPNTVVQSSFETIKVAISLNFIGMGKPDDLYTAAAKAKKWLVSNAGSEFCETKEIVPRILGDISDRSVLIDTDNELRVGFDIRLDCDNVTEEEIVMLQEVELNGEIIEQPEE